MPLRVKDTVRSIVSAPDIHQYCIRWLGLGGSGGPDQRQAARSRAGNSFHGNRPVECSEAAVIADGEAEQIRIGDLLMAAYGGYAKEGIVE
jgi:hypothetical protein